MRTLILSAFTFALVCCVHGSTVGGKVIAIIDGDSISISSDSRGPLTVHLHGIAAPELDQPFGVRAKEELTKLTLGRSVEIYVDVEISSTEIAGVVFYVTDRSDVSRNANIEMISQGFAWYDPKSGLVKGPQCDSKERNMNLVDYALDAKKARRGLWSDKAALPPWEWRKIHPKKEEPIQPPQTTTGSSAPSRV